MRAYPGRYRLRYCRDADHDHARDPRAYAHVFHHEDGVICLARTFADLPENFQLGILLHEIGHCLAGPDADEAAATDAIERAAKLRIYYQHSEQYGDALEWIDPSDLRKARRFVDVHCDFGER